MITFNQLIQHSRRLEEDLRMSLVDHTRFGEEQISQSNENDKATALRDELEAVQRLIREKITEYL